MVRICKSFTFDAAHYLPHVPDGHQCKRMHGHTYRVEVMAEGQLDERGMVIDYAEIADVWQVMHNALDHRCLNDVAGLENPTTEVLAPWILDRVSAACPLVIGVRVYESTATWCEVFALPTQRDKP